MTFPVSIPKRPVGITVRAIADIMSDFDALLAVFNDSEVDQQSLKGVIPESKLIRTDQGLSKGCFYIYRNTSQSLNTGDVIQHDAARFDVSSWADIVTNKGRFTPQQAGYYRLTAAVNRSSGIDSDEYYLLVIRKNGVAHAQGPLFFGGAGFDTVPVGASVSAIVQANGSSDYFDVALVHNLSGSTAISSTAVVTYFCGELVASV